MNHLFKTGMFYLLAFTLPSSLFSGGAEGHGGGEDRRAAVWMSRANLAKKSLEAVIKVPNEFPWTTVHAGGFDLFTKFQAKLETTLRNTKLIEMNSSEAIFYAETCITLSSYGNKLEFYIAPKMCENFESSFDGVLYEMVKILLSEVSFPESGSTAFANDLVAVISQKLNEMKPISAGDLGSL